MTQEDIYEECSYSKKNAQQWAGKQKQKASIIIHNILLELCGTEL